MNKNEVELRGTITRKFKTDKVLIVTMVTGRDYYKNFPQVVFFGDMAADVDANYEIGDHITVEGKIQSRIRNVDDRKIYVQGIYASKVEKTSPLEDDPNRYPTSYNKIMIQGEVVFAGTRSDNMVYGVVKTTTDDRMSYVAFTKFDKQPEIALAKLETGTQVQLKGYLQTSRKEKEGEKPRFFQTVVIQSIHPIANVSDANEEKAEDSMNE